MAYDLDSRLVIGVSTRALFDLCTKNEVFEKEGLESYRKYQTEHDGEPGDYARGFVWGGF